MLGCDNKSLLILKRSYLSFTFNRGFIINIFTFSKYLFTKFYLGEMKQINLKIVNFFQIIYLDYNLYLMNLYHISNIGNHIRDFKSFFLIVIILNYQIQLKFYFLKFYIYLLKN